MCEQYNLQTLQFMVVDEADKMFELGFLQQIETILSSCKSQQNICKFLFSATMQPGVEEIVKGIMNDPLRIQVGIKNSTASTID